MQTMINLNRLGTVSRPRKVSLAQLGDFAEIVHQRSSARFVTVLRPKLLGLLFLLLPFSGFSQTENYQNNYDFWQWFDISASHKLFKKTTGFINTETRFMQNMSMFNLFYVDLGLKYKISKTFKASATYRLNEKGQQEDGFSTRHRVLVDITASHKFFHHFDCSYRCRLQTQVRNVFSSDHGGVPQSYWRNKVQVDYTGLKKITPYVSTEFRFQIHNAVNGLEYADGQFVRVRYYLGFDYDLPHHQTLGAYLMHQRDFNVIFPGRELVIGLSYSFDP